MTENRAEHPVVPAKAGTSHPRPAQTTRNGTKWNEMEQNGTELKVSPLLGTPDEANQGHSQGQLAHRVRVSGGPKRGHTGLISIARLGVNEAKQGQMGPGFTPPPIAPALAGNLASPAPAGSVSSEWKKTRMRAKPPQVDTRRTRPDNRCVFPWQRESLRRSKPA